jgi:hypothetical protein
MTGEETFWLTVLVQVQLVFILMTVVIFFMIPRQGKKEFIELGLLLIICFIAEAVGTIGAQIIRTNMNLAINIFYILNFPLALLVYRRRIHWKNVNSITYLLVGCFVLFGLLNLFFIQGPFNFNSYTSSLASILFILTSLTYFYILVQELPTEEITKLPMFWINTAMLIYYSGTFFLYLSADYLINVLKNNLIAIWLIHNFLGLIFYSIIGYGLLLIRKEHLAKQSVASLNN